MQTPLKHTGKCQAQESTSSMQEAVTLKKSASLLWILNATFAREITEQITEETIH